MILKRYLLKEHVSPFLISLLVVTFILMIDRIVDLLNIIIEKKLDIQTLLQVFGLSLPFMLALSIPMAVLVATILAFGRMTVDREMIALKSCGINVYRLLGPLLIAALALTGVMVYFNHFFLPESNHKLKNLMIKIAYYKPMTIIKPNEFNSILDYTIFVKENNASLLKDVVIYDRSESRFPKTIIASSGTMHQLDDGNTLQINLTNGEMHERSEKEPGKYSIRKFEQFTVYIRNIGARMDFYETGYRSDREMTHGQLVIAIKDKKKEIAGKELELQNLSRRLESEGLMPRTFQSMQSMRRLAVQKSQVEVRLKEVREAMRSLKVEYHKKFAISFAIIIFVLIGIPLGLMTRSSGIGMAFSVSSIIFLTYYIALTGGEQLADKGHITPFFSMWLINLIFFVLSVILIIASIYEKKLIDLHHLAWRLSHLKAKKQDIPDEILH